MQSPLKIEPATGLLAGIRQVLSPFYDARPTGVLPELIVVHGISMPPGEFGGPWIDRLFTGNLPPDAHPFFKETSKLRVSAHVVIQRDGTIIQYVPFGQRAWSPLSPALVHWREPLHASAYMIRVLSYPLPLPTKARLAG